MRFGVLGDLHYSVFQKPELCKAREEFYERLFHATLEQRPDAVFAIGDTTDNGQPEEFDGLHAVARRTGLSFITVNGNHDLLNQTKSQIARWTGNPNPYFTLKYHPLNGAHGQNSREASSFVVLDTPKELSPKDHGGYVGPEQLSWLKGQIDESGDRPLFVFGHHPVQGATRWAAFPMLNIDNSRDVKFAFFRKQEGEAFYFCGHNHANSIIRRQNWSFVQTAAPLRTCDFRVIDFSPEEVKISTVKVKGHQAHKLANRVMDGMGDFLKLPARGFPGDRHYSVALQPVAPLRQQTVEAY